MFACPVLLASVCSAAPRSDPTLVLGFERIDNASVLSHWRSDPSGPDSTLFLDSTSVHGGRYSGRLERTTSSPATFSACAFEIPVKFKGDTLELRGWLRYQDVVGMAGLWQRQDRSVAGPMPAIADGPTILQFDNMAARQLRGTADWVEYSVKLPLDPTARKVTVGAQLMGTGRVWADDLRLFVDGKPLAEAPEKVTVFDTDTSFDAGSRITIETVTPKQLDYLVLLGKAWGFLKYHHPAVVRGDRQWDFDLFRVLPGVLTAKNAVAAQRELSRWITGLGPVPPCTTCVQLPTTLVLSPRLGWLADRARLGDALSAQLVAVHERRPKVDEQFFVAFGRGARNPDFSNELNYPRQNEPDPGYRLLALFRIWNIIEYWTPNRELADSDWDATLREFIPRFLAARTKTAYQLELLALIARVNDTHSNVWSSLLEAQPPAGSADLPVRVRFVEEKAVVAEFTNPRLGPATGLQVGDVIAAIDGVPVDSLVARRQPFYAASNPSARLRDMARSLTRGMPGSVQLSVLRVSQQLALRAERVPVDSINRERERKHDHEGPTFRRLSSDVAYLKLSSVKTVEVNDYLNGMKGARCLVIDLRNYPSAFMVFDLGCHLVREPTPFVKFTAGDMQNPGAFSFGNTLTLYPSKPYVECPVAILVDEITQSQAEYTTMALRSRPGTVVVGSQTSGADGTVSAISVPGAQSTTITGVGVYYPDGTLTQGIGIVPDLEVRPTIAGIRAGRDELIEAAVQRVLGRAITAEELRALTTPGSGPRP
jgi:C-terminal processing protease CtpA/Prc